MACATKKKTAIARHEALLAEAKTLKGISPEEITPEQLARVKAIPADIDAAEAEIEEATAYEEEVKREQEEMDKSVQSAKAFREEPRRNGRLVTHGQGSEAAARQAARAKARQNGEHDDEDEDPEDLQEEIAAGRAVSLKALSRVFAEARSAPTIGEILVRDPRFREAREGDVFRNQRINFNLKGKDVTRAVKAVMMTTNGFAPDRMRIGVVTEIPIRPATLQQFIPTQTTSSGDIEWMAQTVRVNAAAPVAEGAQKPEGEKVFEARSLKPQVIAEWLPVTNQQLADVPQLRTLIDSQLMEEVRNEEEDQIVAGNGVAPNLTGLLTRPGRFELTQAVAPGLAGESVGEALERAATTMRTTARLRPNVIVMNPTDMMQMKFERGAEDGQYVLGHPLLRRDDMWRYTMVESDVLPENTALVLDTTRMVRWVRDEINVMVGYINDQFIRNTITILCEIRVALAVYREDAIAEVSLTA
jgi:HK97 family phage major capsid protein